jgi:hypothetical protein
MREHHDNQQDFAGGASQMTTPPDDEVKERARAAYDRAYQQLSDRYKGNRGFARGMLDSEKLLWNELRDLCINEGAAALAAERARALADRDAQWRAGLNLTDADFDGFTMEELCEIVEGGRRCAETAHKLLREKSVEFAAEEMRNAIIRRLYTLSGYWNNKAEERGTTLTYAINEIRARARGDEKA